MRYGHRATMAGSFGGASDGRGDDQAALHAFFTRTRSEGFGAEVQRRVLTGCYVLSAKAYSAYYERALAARLALQRDFHRAFQSVDVLLTPTTPTGPFPQGQTSDPASLMLNDIMTIPPSLAGLPAVSVPVLVAPSTHVDGAGNPVPVPVGLQLVGRALDEAGLLRVAAALEAYSGFSDLVPDYVLTGRT